MYHITSRRIDWFLEFPKHLVIFVNGDARFLYVGYVSDEHTDPISASETDSSTFGEGKGLLNLYCAYRMYRARDDQSFLIFYIHTLT